MKTGMPTSSVTRKMNMAMGMSRSIGRYLLGVVVGTLPAMPRMRPDGDDLPEQHQKAAEGDAAIDVAHRQVEHRHGLALHPLGDGDREPGEEREEAKGDEVDHRKQRGAQGA